MSRIPKSQLLKPHWAKRLILGATLCFVAACETAPTNEVKLYPATEAGFQSISVVYTFEGNESGSTSIEFPSQWGPESDLENLISNITVLDEESATQLEISANGLIKHAPGTSLRLSYDVTQDYEGEPQWGVVQVPGMRPVLQDTYASIIGHTVFADIMRDDGSPAAFSLHLEGLPQGSTAGFSQMLDEYGRSRSLSGEALKDSILTAGTFRAAESSGDTLNVRGSIRGTWNLTDQEFVDTARNVLVQAGEFFEDQPFDDYFLAISAMPPLPEGSATIGTGLTNSFFVLATENTRPEELRHIIVHEILHEWIVRRMGVTDEESDPLRMWFTEGFTEYYTQLTLLKSDMISLDGFVENMNTLWAEYQASPVRTLTNADMADNIWESQDLMRLPYNRGVLLAFHWDQIAKSENGAPLASAQIQLLDAAELKRDATGEKPTLSDDDIANALRRVIGPDFDADFQKYIEDGAEIEGAALRLPACLQVTRSKDGVQIFAIRSNADETACVRSILAK